MTEREVAIPGVVGRITVSEPGLFRGAQILVDGAPAQKGGWGKVILRRADGTTVEAKLVDHLTRSVPSVKIGADKYELGKRVPTVLIVLALLPLGLPAVGGAIGGLCGGIAFFVNQGLLRSNKAMGLKLALMSGVALAAAAAYFAIATLLYAATH